MITRSAEPRSGRPVPSRLAGSEIGWLVVVLTLTTAGSTPLLVQPFAWDQGIFAAIADTMRRGGLIYRDAWDHKPPGVHAAYALAFVVFGRSWTSVHLLELILFLAAAVALWSIVRRWSRPAGIATAGFLGLGRVVTVVWYDHGQPELFIAALSAIGFGLIVLGGGSDRRRLPALLAGGLLLGLLPWFKQTAIFLTIGGLGAFWLAARPDARFALVDDERNAAGFRDWGVLVFGIVAGLLGPIAPFALAGTVGELWDATVVFNALHAAGDGRQPVWVGIYATGLYLWGANLLAPLALVGLIAARRERVRAGAVLLLWLVLAYAGFWAQGKFFTYHWHVVLPPLAAFAGIGAVRIAAEVRRRGLGRPVYPAAIAISVVIFGGLLVQNLIPTVHRDLPFVLGRMTTEQYEGQFHDGDDEREVYSLLAARRTAEYVRERTSAGDTVLVWGFQPLVNWLAERRPPTRYLFNYPLTIERADNSWRETARAGFLADFDAARPVFVVVVVNDTSQLQEIDSAAQVERFPGLRDRLARDYRFDREIGEYRIYRRS